MTTLPTTEPISPLLRLPVRDGVQLLLRLGLGGIFWSSGQTKVDGGLHVSDAAVELFREEYRLPLIDASLAAHLAAYAEHLFPLLLLLGLATRLSAAALFAMTLVIQIFVYPDALVSTHLGWLAMALAVIVLGPGRASLDALMARRLHR